jgi:hypothetical protein
VGFSKKNNRKKAQKTHKKVGRAKKSARISHTKNDVLGTPSFLPYHTLFCAFLRLFPFYLTRRRIEKAELMI